MAPSNKKQRGRKNRKNQTLSASASASASALASSSDASRMVTDSDGFPTSDFYQRGNHLIANGGGRETISNNVMGIYLQGAETGCIPSMVNYANCYLSQYKPHLALPFLLEGAIRGHPNAVALLLCRCYANLPQFSLYFYWSNTVKNWAGIEEERYKQFFGGAKKMKNQFDNTCCICSEQQSDLVDLKTCNGCKLSFYCLLYTSPSPRDSR